MVEKEEGGNSVKVKGGEEASQEVQRKSQKEESES